MKGQSFFTLNSQDLKVVAEYHDFVMFYGGSFYVGLTTHKGALNENVFNGRNVGMDHLCFLVDSTKGFNESVSWLEQEGIPHGAIEKLSNGMWVVSFRDPDNIQLEFGCKD